ncbi:MAG: phenylalanine--tRNA ligase subunit beta, partial [Nakamurella sp.]
VAGADSAETSGKDSAVASDKDGATDSAAGGVVIGYAGELHPAVIERLGLPTRTLAFEVDLSAVGSATPPIPPAVSPFPPVLLDVALVVDAGVDADSVMRALRDGGGELLESTRLFDVYDGNQIADGKKSLAFSLVVRAADRTLTAAEATEVRDAAINEAAARTHAEVRA